MFYLSVAFALFLRFQTAKCDENCEIHCPFENDPLCAFDMVEKTYKMFASKCSMAGYTECNNKSADLVQTPIKYCIKYHYSKSRRGYGESCPVFCPTHYSPVCAASMMRSYVYRAFRNGCQLDMLNCRGDDDYNNFVEVPLDFCQKHLMMNIHNEQMVFSNMHDYRDFD